MKDNSAVRHIREYLIKQGEEPTDKAVIGRVLDSDIIEEVIDGGHRWYDDTTCVIEFDGMFIAYDGFHITGDNSAYDIGLSHNIDSVREVEKKEVTVTKYVNKN